MLAGRYSIGRKLDCPQLVYLGYSSGVASPKIWEGPKIWGPNCLMLDE